MNFSPEKAQEAVQTILNEAVETGEDLGCQAAVYYRGREIVNAAAGLMAKGGNKVTVHSLFPVFSTGKGIISTVAHRLVEQGIMSYDTRIADLWPEFGCNGKEDIRLWHVMSHRTGVYVTPEFQTPEELADWRKMTGKIARATPVCTPGTRTNYQSVNYSWLLGEVLRRVSGLEIPDLLRKELTGPLGIETEFFYGLPPEAESRGVFLERESAMPRNTAWKDLDVLMNTPVIRQACLPGFNAMASAHALARHYAALLDSGADGMHPLKPETVQTATTLHRSPDDPVPLVPGTWELFGLGYVLSGPKDHFGLIFGHGGYGASEGLADVSNQLAVGYTNNRIHGVSKTRYRIYQYLNLKSRDW